MNTLVPLVSIAGICLLAQACSTGRPPSYMEHTAPINAARQTKDPASPETQPSSSNTTPTLHRIVLEDKTLTNYEVGQLFAQGYKPTERHGEVYYCRREKPTGSHFETMICRTGQELKRLTQTSKDVVTKFQGTGACMHSGNGPAC